MAFLGDQAGTPVADAMPVVFQSTLGAVGSCGMGGCTTTNALDSAVSVSPSLVQNVFPPNALGVADRMGSNIQGNQGSWHTVTINSLTPANCVVGVDSTFYVANTTPWGNVTSYPFTLKFSCS